MGEFWSARVNDAYRALAVREGNIFTWFWIGTHDEYERMLNGCDVPTPGRVRGPASRAGVGERLGDHLGQPGTVTALEAPL